MKNFSNVIHDLYRGSAPNEEDLHILKKIGIKKIVSLDLNVAKKIEPICKELKFKHVTIPISEDKKSINLLLKLNLKRLLLSEPTFVHCLYGKDRTGLIIALLKVKYLGVQPEKAIKDAEKFGFGIGLDPHAVNSMKQAILSCKDLNSVDDGTILNKSREESISTNSPFELNNLDGNNYEPNRSAPFGMTYRPFYYLDQEKNDTTDNLSPGLPQIGERDNSYSEYGSGITLDSNVYH